MSTIFAACQSRSFDQAIDLLASDDADDLQQQLAYRKLDGSTVLHCALENNAPEPLIRRLLELGLSPNSELKHVGMTALHLAAKHSRPAHIVRLLVEFGAQVDKQTNVNATPLLIACNFNASPDTVQALLQHGANVHHVDSHGFGCMYWAVQGGCSLELGRVLLDFGGADPNAKPHEGGRRDTPTLLALTRCKRNASAALGLLMLLLQYGGDMSGALEAARAENVPAVVVHKLEKTRVLLTLCLPRALATTTTATLRRTRSPAAMFPSDLARMLAQFLV